MHRTQHALTTQTSTKLSKLVSLVKKMFSAHKNSYLQQRTCDINPRIINRAVDLARQQPTIDTSDFEPPLNRLTSEQPCIPISNIDVTRRPLAFGRLALPKLRRELHHPEEDVVIAAVTTLIDLMKNPERGYEAVKLRIPDRLADLLTSENATLRERVCMALQVLAELADGKEAIVKNSKILASLALLLDDDEGAVRMKAAALVAMVSFFWKAAEELVEYGFVPILLDCITKDCEEIASFHLKSLNHMMASCDGLEQALEHDAYSTLIQLLESSNPQLRAQAMKCMATLLETQQGKEMAYESNLLPELNRLLHSEILEIYQAAAEVIVFATIKSAAKIRATRVVHLPDRLVTLLHDYDNPPTQLFCLQALTNICEHPIIRKHVCENYYDELQTLYVCNDKELQYHKDILLKVVGWVPQTS